MPQSVIYYPLFRKEQLRQLILHSCGSQMTGLWWHGSVGRAHRSHRWGRWFESNCHHHSEALVDQGLRFFALHPGVYFPGVFFVGMNSSENTSCPHYRAGSVAGMSGWLCWWNDYFKCVYPANSHGSLSVSEYA